MDTRPDTKAAELFNAALKLSEEQRDAFLIKKCADDPGMLAQRGFRYECIGRPVAKPA